MKCVGFHAIYVMDDVEMNENRGKLMKACFQGNLTPVNAIFQADDGTVQS